MQGNKYLLSYREQPDERWKTVEGRAETEMGFLEGVDDRILQKKEWVVYEVVRGTHKDDYVHSGEIDELVEDPEQTE